MTPLHPRPYLSCFVWPVVWTQRYSLTLLSLNKATGRCLHLHNWNYRICCHFFLEKLPEQFLPLTLWPSCNDLSSNWLQFQKVQCLYSDFFVLSQRVVQYNCIFSCDVTWCKEKQRCGKNSWQKTLLTVAWRMPQFFVHAYSYSHILMFHCS